MAKQNKFSIVYITFTSEKEAEKIGSFLIKSKLAACVNIFPPHISIYEWEGKISKSKEVAAIVKTSKTNVKKIINEFKKHHSYKCPAIISLNINDGNKEFLDWITKSVQ